MRLLWKYYLLFACTLPLEGKLILVPEATNPVIIDGVIEAGEWQDAISNTPILNLVDGTSEGLTDISGNVSLKWDSVNLYLLFQVTDDERSLDSTDGYALVVNTFDDDSVEIYLDINHTNEGRLNLALGRYQYRFIPKEDGEIETFPGNLPTAGFSFAHQGTNSYVLEILMPWSTLGVENPSMGNTIGFDVVLNDDDDGETRDAQLFWNAVHKTAWQDASQWGDIQLTGAKPANPPSPSEIPIAPIVNIFKLDGENWVAWDEAEGFHYQLRHSADLSTWLNDNREIFSTGPTRYFNLTSVDIQSGRFFELLVTVEE